METVLSLIGWSSDLVSFLILYLVVTQREMRRDYDRWKLKVEKRLSSIQTRLKINAGDDDKVVSFGADR